MKSSSSHYHTFSLRVDFFSCVLHQPIIFGADCDEAFGRAILGSPEGLIPFEHLINFGGRSKLPHAFTHTPQPEMNLTCVIRSRSHPSLSIFLLQALLLWPKAYRCTSNLCFSRHASIFCFTHRSHSPFVAVRRSNKSYCRDTAVLPGDSETVFYSAFTCARTKLDLTVE